MDVVVLNQWAVSEKIRRVHGVSGKGRPLAIMRKFYAYPKPADQMIDQMAWWATVEMMDWAEIVSVEWEVALISLWRVAKLEL